MSKSAITLRVNVKTSQIEETDGDRETGEEKEQSRLCKETRRPWHDFVTMEINATTKDADSDTREIIKWSHQEEKTGTNQKTRGTHQETNVDMVRSAIDEIVTFLTPMIIRETKETIETRATTERGTAGTRATTDRGTTDQGARTR